MVKWVEFNYRDGSPVTVNVFAIKSFSPIDDDVWAKGTTIELIDQQQIDVKQSYETVNMLLRGN